MKVSIATSGGIFPLAPKQEIEFEIDELPSELRRRASKAFSRSALGSIQSRESRNHTADARSLIVTLLDDASRFRYEFRETSCPANLLDLIDDISKR